MECLQRRSMHHERDRDFVRSAHALVVIIDIAEHEIDFVQVGEMIDDLGRRRRVGLGAGREQRSRRDGERELQQIASAHDDSRYFLCRIAASSLRSVTSDLHSSRLVRSSRNILSSAPPGKPRGAAPSGSVFFQIRMRSSLMMTELSPLARLTAMPPPSQSTSHWKAMPAAGIGSVSALRTGGAWPHSPLESKS